jgi:hypothetical protein
MLRAMSDSRPALFQAVLDRPADDAARFARAGDCNAQGDPEGADPEGDEIDKTRDARTGQHAEHDDAGDDGDGGLVEHDPLAADECLRDRAVKLEPTASAVSLSTGAIMQTADDEVIALIEQYAKVAASSDGTVRAMQKCKLLDQLGKTVAYSDTALAVVAEALADEDEYEFGASPYDAWYEIVAEHAYNALLPIAARAERVVTAQLENSLCKEDDAVRRHGSPPSKRVLDQTGVRCREYAANLLKRLPVLPPEAIDALMRCASDPSRKVQLAVGAALGGQPAATSLLSDPTTVTGGLIAAPEIDADLLIELLGHRDSDIRRIAASRLRTAIPRPDHAVASLMACLADPQRDVVRESIIALGKLAPDDATVTEALFSASRTGNCRSDALNALAERSVAQLRPLVPKLLAWFLSNDDYHDDVATVLCALGEEAPPEVAHALGKRLAALSPMDERAHHFILHALRGIGRTALPVLLAIEVAMHHSNKLISTAATEIAAALHAQTQR